MKSQSTVRPPSGDPGGSLSTSRMAGSSACRSGRNDCAAPPAAWLCRWVVMAALALAAVTTAGTAAAWDNEHWNTAKAVEADAAKAARELQGGPRLHPDASRTSFDPALHCMDRLFATYGIRDIALLIEDIPDMTKKINVGAREMFISATSRMTQRSRAIRLVPYQRDSVAFMDRRDVLQNVGYVLQGSVSQLDESLVRGQRDGSICLGPLCIGVATSNSYSALGLDLSVIRTGDLSLVPGVTARNSVLVVKRGSGADGELNLGKFGVNFNLSYATSEGNGQALRALIELGSIELLGKLLRIPYWTCLGNDLNNPDVAAEADDWWEGLAADPAALIKWLQTQMTARGLYSGPVDGIGNDSLLRAVRAYKTVLDLGADGELDARFLRAYLAADHARLERPALEALAKLTPPAVTGALAGAPAESAASAVSPSLEVTDLRGGHPRYLPGEVYQLEVVSRQPGYLYCWLIDEHQRLNHFFPDALHPRSVIPAQRPVALPGALGFELFASPSGSAESVVCGLSGQDLGADPLAASASASASGGWTAESWRTRFSEVAGTASTLATYNVTLQ